jgi:hypothetical protein
MNIIDTFSDGNWMGLCIARHFSKEEFGDLLPPTYRAELDLPQVKQARAMVAFQLLQELAQIEQRKMMQANPNRARKALKAALAQQLATR